MAQSAAGDAHARRVSSGRRRRLLVDFRCDIRSTSAVHISPAPLVAAEGSPVALLLPLLLSLCSGEENDLNERTGASLNTQLALCAAGKGERSGRWLYQTTTCQSTPTTERQADRPQRMRLSRRTPPRRRPKRRPKLVQILTADLEQQRQRVCSSQSRAAEFESSPHLHQPADSPIKRLLLLFSQSTPERHFRCA